MDENNKVDISVNNDESKWTEDNQKELEIREKWLRLKELRKAMEEDEKELQKKKVQDKQKEEAKKIEEFKKEKEDLGVSFEDDFMENTDGELSEEMENYLADVEATGEYKDVFINPRLQATFKKTIRGEKASGVAIILKYGDYISQAYSFARKQITAKNWEDCLKNTLFDHEVRPYSDEEIRIIAEITRRALENAKTKDVSGEVFFRSLIKDLYYKAYTVKVKYSKKRPEIDMPWENWLDINNVDDSIRTITLLNFREYGECICICDKKKVLEELLKQLEVNEKWTPLEFKIQLKLQDFLVIGSKESYASLIQINKFKLEEFKSAGLRKFLIIPVNNVTLKPWIEEIKQEIKGEDETETVEKVENE